MSKKRTCNGCRANTSFCTLGFKRQFHRTSFGVIDYIPTEECPKPKTNSKYMELAYDKK